MFKICLKYASRRDCDCIRVGERYSVVSVIDACPRRPRTSAGRCSTSSSVKWITV
jgi:hypothetical protein